MGSNKKLKEKLDKFNWIEKIDLYTKIFDFKKNIKKVKDPVISIIVISWRLHPDTLKCFQLLEKQRDQNFELIFVNNGADEKEFESLEPFIDKYIKLNTNTGAYVARNIGALFADSNILFFLEDDGIPDENLIKSHIELHDKYDIISLRGVYTGKTDNKYNALAHHYYLGSKTFPRYSELEGNSSYSAKEFFSVGGWDDRITFGGGGIDLSIRLFKKYPFIHKQIYSPKPIIFHDFVKDEEHLINKQKKQELSFERLKSLHKNWTEYQLWYQKYKDRSDLLVKKDSELEQSLCKKDLIVVWYQNDWGLYGRRNEKLSKAFARDNRFNRVFHIEPPVNLDHFNPSSTNLDDNITINSKRMEGFEDDGVITFTPTFRGELNQNKLNEIVNQIAEFFKKYNLDNYILWLYPPHFISLLMYQQFANSASLVISDIVDDHRKYYDGQEKIQIRNTYSSIVGQSDLVFTVSEIIRDEFSEYNSNIVFLPNAAESIQYTDKINSEILQNIEGPIIGYSGALSFRIDLELLNYISDKNWNIVLIGTSPNQGIQELAKRENVFVLPPVKNTELKKYIQKFDVCIIPHEVNEVTDSMNPLKLYDYMELGKPIVTTRIAGVEEFSSYINIADSHESFRNHINEIIKNKSYEVDYSNCLRYNTWDSRVDIINNLIEENLKMKKNIDINEYYNRSRPEIQELVNPSSKRILDVGCGEGVMASQLKQKLNAEVWGIEYVEDVALTAKKKIDKVFSGSVENNLNNLPDNYFDTIIFADVLEHLVDPENLIREIKTKLKADGEIIASIPNVRHWSVLLNLLQGNWDYEEEGLLDKTHLRFFTKNSIVKMFNKLGGNIKDIQATSLLPTDGKIKTIWDNVVKLLSNSGLNVSTLNDEGIYYQYLVKVNFNNISTIIPLYNNLEYTQQFIQSVRESRVFNDELILINNNSSDNTSDFIKDLAIQKDSIKIISNTQNLGFPKAINQGILESSGKYILIANNDIIIPPGSIERMIEVAESDPNIGIVGPISNSVSGVQIDPDAKYDKIEDMYKYAENNRKKNEGEIAAFPRVAFLCTLVKREVIEKIGGLDERFTPGNYEDDDFCLRAQMTGYKTVIAKDVFIHHFGSKSFKADGEAKYAERLKINEAKFIKKWGANPDQIWLKGVQPKSLNPFIPINKDKLVENYQRAQIAVENKEFGMAFEYLTTILNNKESKNNFSELELDKIKELKDKISKLIR